MVCILLVCGSFQKKPSVLMVAADSDAADCVTLLLNHNASVTEVDEKGYNALCRAILNEKKVKIIFCVRMHICVHFRA